MTTLPRPRYRPRLLVAAATVMAVVVLSGCGVPIDSSPSALPRKGIPFGLLQKSAPPTTTTSVPSTFDYVTEFIFLVAPSGHLVQVAREVPASQESLATVLRALVQGPTNTEAQTGLESAVPAQTTVLGAEIGPAGIATVNLGGTFRQLVGQGQIQAVAQIVFTASALEGVTGVTFELAGAAVDVPVASGAQVPVANRNDFAPLAPQL